MLAYDLSYMDVVSNNTLRLTDKALDENSLLQILHEVITMSLPVS